MVASIVVWARRIGRTPRHAPTRFGREGRPLARSLPRAPLSSKASSLFHGRTKEGRKLGDWIRDIEDADFESAVIQGSRAHPVVVDFWAPWCGPCRTLGPILERVVMRQSGACWLARIDIDANPETAARFGIRSIPAVLAIRDGAIVDQFVGAQTEAVVERFVAGALPSEGDLLAREGAALFEAGHGQAARERFERARELEATHGPATVGLARVLAESAESARSAQSAGSPSDSDSVDPLDAALELLGTVLNTSASFTEAELLAAQLRTRAGGGAGAGAEGVAAMRARLAGRPGDLQLRLDLGRQLAAKGETESALAELVEVVRRDATFEDGAARRAMLDLFEVLGPEHPLTGRYRRELAGALFR